MIGYVLLIYTLLFLGLVVWFAAFGSKDTVVITNLASLASKLVQELPPLPSIDIIMWLRLGFFVLIAVFIHEYTEDLFLQLSLIWDNVFREVWLLLTDLTHIVVFFYDLLVPLYNWWVTLFAQLTEGTYSVVIKCQLSALTKSLVLLGDAMVALAISATKFIPEPFEQPFDIAEPVHTLQLAIATQESTLSCACDGLSPALGFAFEAVKPVALSYVVNETFNALIAIPQTAVKVFPTASGPGEVPDGARIIAPLRRAIRYLGVYLDDALVHMLRRIHPSIPKFELATPVGYLGSAALGFGESVLHVVTHFMMQRDITFHPKNIFQDVDHAINTAVSTGMLVTSPAELTEFSKKQRDNTILGVKHALKFIIGIPHVAMDYWFRLLRDEYKTYNFMGSLQHADGKYIGGANDQEGYERMGCDEVFCDRATLQSEFFYEFDKSMMHFKRASLVQGWQPTLMRVVMRTFNVLLRFIFSGQDIVNERYFHVPINCGYGESDEVKINCVQKMCDFYYPGDPYSPEPTNPCNSLTIEWVFEQVEEFADVFSNIFSLIRPTSTGCLEFPAPRSAIRSRCAKSSSDFLCATEITTENLVKIPLQFLRHIYSYIMVIFQKPTDVNTFDFEDRICDVSTALYSAIGNVFAALPDSILNQKYTEKFTDLIHSILVGAYVSMARGALVGVKFFASLFGAPINWDTVVDNIERDLIDFETNKLHSLTKPSASSPGLTTDVPDKIGNFIISEIVISTNYFINVLQAAQNVMTDTFTGGSFFSGLRKIVLVVKKALSKEYVNWVTLSLKVLGHLFSFFQEISQR